MLTFAPPLRSPFSVFLKQDVNKLQLFSLSSRSLWLVGLGEDDSYSCCVSPPILNGA